MTIDATFISMADTWSQYLFLQRDGISCDLCAWQHLGVCPH